MIVGNKIDLTDDEEVPYNTALEFSNALGAIFKLTSAKDSKGIEDLFDTIAQRIEKSEQLLENSFKKGESIKRQNSRRGR